MTTSGGTPPPPRSPLAPKPLQEVVLAAAGGIADDHDGGQHPSKRSHRTDHVKDEDERLIEGIFRLFAEQDAHERKLHQHTVKEEVETPSDMRLAQALTKRGKPVSQHALVNLTTSFSSTRSGSRSSTEALSRMRQRSAELVERKRNEEEQRSLLLLSHSRNDDSVRDDDLSISESRIQRRQNGGGSHSRNVSSFAHHSFSLLSASPPLSPLRQSPTSSISNLVREMQRKEASKQKSILDTSMREDDEEEEKKKNNPHHDEERNEKNRRKIVEVAEEEMEEDEELLAYMQKESRRLVEEERPSLCSSDDDDVMYDR